MRTVLPVLAALLPLASSYPQLARPTERLDQRNDVSRGEVLVAADEDVCAVLYDDRTNHEVLLTLSDGRGVHWSRPLRVDQDPMRTAKVLTDDSLQVLGNRVYVSWMDSRGGTRTSDLFLNVFDVTTGQLLGEQWVDKGYPLGNGSVSDWKMVVAEEAGTPIVHFLIRSSGRDPFVSVNNLWFVSTNDEGATYRVKRNLTPGGIQTHWRRFDLAANASNVHLAFVDTRNAAPLDPGREIFYLRSLDGGHTFQPTTQLDLSGPGTGDVDAGLELAASTSMVCVAWVEYTSGVAGSDRLHVNVSTNAGASFQGDQIVGQYALTNTWIQEPEVVIEPDSGHVIVGWNDYRGGTPGNGPARSFTATSIDGGITWQPDAQLSPAGAFHIRAPQGSAHLADGSRTVTFVWTDASAGQFTGTFASTSRDGGLTWEAPLRLIGDSSHGRLAYTSRYGNYVAAWLRAGPFGALPHEVIVGGFRPPSVTPIGWTAGSRSAFFRLNGFSQAGYAAVALSFAEGPLRLPDGRNTGLSFDPLFLVSLTLLGSSLGTPLNGRGSGDTPATAFNPPPGLTFHAAGVSLLPVPIGELTDVVRVTVQ